MPRTTQSLLYSNWCFTINNWTDEDKTQLLALPYTYLLFGEEVGAEGTPHLQGYVQLKTRVRLGSLSKLLPRASLRNALGSAEQNDAYCKKDGTYTELGTPKPGKGVPSVAERALRNKRLLDPAVSLEELVANEELSPHNVRAIKNARMDISLDNNERNPPPNLSLAEPTSHEWYYGEPRSGKTTHARTNHPDAYLKSKDQWWCLYKGEDTVIVEDLGENHVKLLDDLKEWADYWQFKAQVKGGQLGKIRPKKIIVTSNYHPEELWPNPKQHDPILARFKLTRFSRIDSLGQKKLQPSSSYATGGASRWPLGQEELPAFTYTDIR